MSLQTKINEMRQKLLEMEQNMREISFRAWDKIRCEYIGFGGLQHSEKYGEHITPNIRTNDNQMTLNPNFYYSRNLNLVYQQFTGLLDKNGTRIFEGDIVKIYFEDEYSNDCVLVDGLTEKNVRVKFDYQGVYGEEKDQTWYYFPDLINKDVEYEVIGNVHENPELLNSGRYVL